MEEQYLRHSVTQYEFDNPVSSVLSCWYSDVVTDADLPEEEWTALKRFIRDSGFETLADRYGAPMAFQCYSYNLTIAWGVVFRPHPKRALAHLTLFRFYSTDFLQSLEATTTTSFRVVAG